MANLDKDNNPTINCCTTTTGVGGIGAGGVYNCVNNHQQITNIPQINLNENLLVNNRIESIESPVYSFSTMTTPSQEDLLHSIDGSCDPLFTTQNDEQIDLGKYIFFA